MSNFFGPIHHRKESLLAHSSRIRYELLKSLRKAHLVPTLCLKHAANGPIWKHIY